MNDVPERCNCGDPDCRRCYPCPVPPFPRDDDEDERDDDETDEYIEDQK